MTDLLFISRSTRPRHSPRVSPALIVASGLLLLTVSGCGKPLLDPKEPRSQYDRFDQVRGQYAPPYLFDAYGRRRPNLEARLKSRD